MIDQKAQRENIVFPQGLFVYPLFSSLSSVYPLPMKGRLYQLMRGSSHGVASVGRAVRWLVLSEELAPWVGEHQWPRRVPFPKITNWSKIKYWSAL